MRDRESLGAARLGLQLDERRGPTGACAGGRGREESCDGCHCDYRRDAHCPELYVLRLTPDGRRVYCCVVGRAYVGLGANLGDRAATLTRAIELLGERPEIAVVAVSSFRETDPVGFLDQPRFLNAAVAIDTSLAPAALLATLLEVEQALGRVRTGQRYGPRTVDLDLLLVDDLTISEPGLELPHPRLHERVFALEPLAELDPALVVPGRGPVQQLLLSLQSSP